MPPAPEDRLAETLHQILGSLDPEVQQQRLQRLSEAFMAPLTRAEKQAAKAKAMQEMFVGMMSEAAGAADTSASAEDAAKAMEELMGGMQELMGSMMGGLGDMSANADAGADPDAGGATGDGPVTSESSDEEAREDQGEVDEGKYADGMQEDDLDLSGLLESLMGSVEGITSQLAPLMGPMMNIALQQMDQVRAQAVSQEWAQHLEDILGKPPDGVSWRELIEALMAEQEGSNS